MEPPQRRLRPDGDSAAGSSPDTAAVLYVCVEHSKDNPSLAGQRAAEEGRSFAEEHRLWIGTEITDAYGEPVPQQRDGWRRLRDMATRGEIGTVITRWPNCISPQHELRYTEIVWLKDHGVNVLFSWAPLAALGSEGR